MYSLSWNWSTLEPIVDRIAARALGLSGPVAHVATPQDDKHNRHQHLHSFLINKQKRKSAKLASFRDRFVESALLLAHELGLPYHSIGLLFDKTIRTGRRALETGSYGTEDLEESKSTGDDDVSVYSVPYITHTQEGAMLVLVREVSGVGHDTVENYLGKGYRFSEIRFLYSVIAQKLGMDRMEASGLLKELKVYAKRGSKPLVQPGGVYVSLFAARPSQVTQNERDILVYGFSRHQIPAYRLPDIEELTPHIRQWIAESAGKSVEYVRNKAFTEALSYNHDGQFHETLMTVLNEESSLDSVFDTKTELAVFQTSLFVAIDAMCLALKDLSQMAELGKLSMEIVDTPSSVDDTTRPAHTILFHATVPAMTASSSHDELIPDYGTNFSTVPTFVFTPYTLFSKAQTALLRGKGSKHFTRDVQLELSKRYPQSSEGLSVLDEILGSPMAGKTSNRRSLLDFSPIIDKTRMLAKILDNKEDAATGKALEDHKMDKERGEIALEALNSPVKLNNGLVLQRRISLPASYHKGMSELCSLSMDIHSGLQTSAEVLPKTIRRASAIAEDVFRSGGSTVPVWVTPPPAFSRIGIGCTPPLSSPPSFKSTPSGHRISSMPKGNAMSASQALRNIITPKQDTLSPLLPSYTSPIGFSPPPLVPVASAHFKFSSTQQASQPHSSPGSVPLSRHLLLEPSPLATLARLRSDGWYHRVMTKIDIGRSADEGTVE